MISRQFFKSSLIYSIVGALPYASGFILLFWYTSWLTPQQFGINALYLPLLLFVQIISTFGLDMTAGVLYFDYKQERQRLREYLGTVFTGLIILGSATVLIFLLGGFRFFTWIFKSSDVMVLLPFGIITIFSGVFNGIFKTYSSLLINQQRPERFFWLNITNFIVTIGASLTLLYLFPFTLYGPVLGRLAPAVISASLSWFLLAREYGLSWNTGYVRKIAGYSAPLMAYSLFGWLVSYIDRFIINGIMDDTVSVGVFDIAVKLMLGIELIIAGLVNTINPKIYNIWSVSGKQESTVEVNRYYNVLTAIVLLMIPLFVIVAPMVLPLVIKKEVYYRAFDFLAILGAGYAIRVLFYMFLAPLMFFKKTAVLPRVFAISAIINIGVGILLIRYFGLIGAVWTSFMIKPVQALLMYFECRKIYTFKLNPWKIIYTPIIFILIVFLSESLAPAGLKFKIEIMQFFAAVVLVYFAYRKELVPMIWKFLGR